MDITPIFTYDPSKQFIDTKNRVGSSRTMIILEDHEAYGIPEAYADQGVSFYAMFFVEYLPGEGKENPDTGYCGAAVEFGYVHVVATITSPLWDEMDVTSQVPSEVIKLLRGPAEAAAEDFIEDANPSDYAPDGFDY